MKKLLFALPVCALALYILPGCASMNKDKEEKEGDEGNEQVVTFDQVPSAARNTLQREAGGAAIDKVDKEQKDGKTVYEADVMINGKNHEIVVTEDGKLVHNKLDDESAERNEKKEKKGEKEDDDKDEHERK